MWAGSHLVQPSISWRNGGKETNRNVLEHSFFFPPPPLAVSLWNPSALIPPSSSGLCRSGKRFQSIRVLFWLSDFSVSVCLCDQEIGFCDLVLILGSFWCVAMCAFDLEVPFLFWCIISTGIVKACCCVDFLYCNLIGALIFVWLAWAEAEKMIFGVVRRRVASGGSNLVSFRAFYPFFPGVHDGIRMICVGMCSLLIL